MASDSAMFSEYAGVQLRQAPLGAIQENRWPSLRVSTDHKLSIEEPSGNRRETADALDESSQTQQALMPSAQAPSDAFGAASSLRHPNAPSPTTDDMIARADKPKPRPLVVVKGSTNGIVRTALMKREERTIVPMHGGLMEVIASAAAEDIDPDESGPVKYESQEVPNDTDVD